MPRHLVTRLRHEDDGFSLMELLFAMTLGSLVLTAVMYVFTTGLGATTRINDRVESSQRARTAMDRITTLLDSQVCLVDTNLTDGQENPSVPPVVPTASTASAITFYADLKGASNTPDRYTITYNPTAKTLTQQRYAGSLDATTKALTWAATPTTTRLADNVQAVGSTPVFSYYKFEASGTDVIVNEANRVAIPFTLSDALQIVRVDVQFQASSTSSAKTGVDDAARTVVTGTGTVATADPSDRTACP
jgi:prepilin-type N-terminal cleavage/methylation domain-containing protein